MTTGSQGFNAIAGSSSNPTAASAKGSAPADPTAEAATKDSSASSLLNTHLTLYIAAFIATAAMVL
jgi:hypothetical protein